jgi:hypothetical protein
VGRLPTTAATPGKQSSLIERATKAGAVGGGPQQIAMSGGATLDVNIRAADGDGIVKLVSTPLAYGAPFIKGHCWPWLRATYFTNP